MSTANHKQNNQEKIRKQIQEKVKEFYKQTNLHKKFIPGQKYISYGGRVYDEKELVALVDSSLDFWLTSGEYAKKLENSLAKFLDVKYCLLTNSGSSANLLAISALTSPKLGKRQLKPGDEVITVACGFPTTLNPILQNNLIPVFVDIELETYNINASKIEKAISKKTKAIFVPHTLGNAFNLDKITKIAKKHKLWLVEDNCDALGSKYNGKYTGSFGDISTLSFYPAHHITTGEGGAVLTNNFQLQRIIASFRDWGRDCWCGSGQDDTCKKRFSWKLGKLPQGYDHKYIYSHIGYNLKITDMQAAVGCAQFKKLPSFIKSRQKNFNSLRKHLTSYEKYLLLPKATEKSNPSWFGFPILVKKTAPFKRGDIVNYLEKNKIATRMLFGGNLLKQPAYESIKYRAMDSLPNTDLVMEDLFWIGVYPGIKKEELEYIKNTFNNFFANL